mmetsp:Transcript_16991/g.34871  ORF Transcript_16991/g.34871 Transcript_16991/m.34871 type:complete len:394 (-) Transcript_16991:253-1434(-)
MAEGEHADRNVRRRHNNEFDVASLPPWGSPEIPSPCKSELEALCRVLEAGFEAKCQVELLAQVKRTHFPSKAEDVKAACGTQHISPLHVVASSLTASYNHIFAALLQKCPGMAALRDYPEGFNSLKGSTPCERLWGKFLKDRKNCVALSRSEKVGKKIIEQNCDVRTLLIQLDMLLQATEAEQCCKNGIKLKSSCGCQSKIFFPRLLQVATHQIVHRTLEWHRQLGIDKDLLHLIFNLFPEQLSAPLEPFTSFEKECDVDATNMFPCPLSNTSPIHQASSDPTICAYVIANALRKQPSLAYCRNHSGRIPLALAIESGRNWSDGLRSIAMAVPGCLDKRDAETGLFPFMLAACEKNAGGESNIDTNTIFALLKLCPYQARTKTAPCSKRNANI